MTAYREFLQHTVPPLLAQLTPESPRLWGKMSAQHMLEHVSALFYLSYHPDKGFCVTPPEHLPKARAFLYHDDKQFRPNTRGPGLPDEPLPLRFDSLDTARTKLLDSMKAFYAYFEAEPGRETLHPVFGSLDLDGWERFHHKHLTHHLRQFGLIPAAPPAAT